MALKILSEFKKFAIRGNVIDLAVGVIIGGAFGKIIDSLVKDVIMPPIGLLLKQVDFATLFWNLSDREFATLAEAQAAGVPTINYGLFLNALVSFLIVAFVIFLTIKQINRLRGEPAGKEPKNISCPHCFSSINAKATRCPQCTSPLKK